MHTCIHAHLISYALKRKRNHFSSYFPSNFERDNLTLQTRAQRKKVMEQLEQNQETLRVDMDSIKGNMEEMKDKMDQLTRAITNMLAREAETEKRKTTSTPTPPLWDGNPLQGFTSDIQGGEAKDGALHPEGSTPTLAHNGASRHVQIPIPQDNYMDLSQQYEEEDIKGMVQESKPVTHSDATVGETRTKDKYKVLEERLKVIEGFNIFGVDAMRMCLVPDVTIPLKFKTPDFEKYKGVSCPKNHLRIFVRKMAAYAANEKLMMHSFQDSLSGAYLDWYMHLERTHVNTWGDLANAFLRQYKYNLDMAPNRMQLQNLYQKGSESFKEYAQRWREVASHVQPPLLENELVDMFMGTLQGPYYKKVISSVSTGFADLVIIGERIENGLKSGKIGKPSSNQNSNKRYSNSNNSKKGETNVVTIERNSQASYNPYVTAVGPNQYPQQAYSRPQTQQARAPPQQNQQNGYARRDRQRPWKEFDFMPITYTQVLPYLIQKGLVEIKLVTPPPNLLPRGYDANSRCDFHAGSPGHTTKKCLELKFKVQDLLERKIISFTPEGPNVKGNPIPGHNDLTINVVEELDNTVLTQMVDHVKTPMSKTHEKLIGYKAFEELHVNCKICLVNLDTCGKMKECLQRMMNDGLV